MFEILLFLHVLCLCMLMTISKTSILSVAEHVRRSQKETEPDHVPATSEKGEHLFREMSNSITYYVLKRYITN